MGAVLPTISTNEVQRISVVQRYNILDTPPDGSFERIAAIAARRFRVPIAIISIVDKDRIWFKSHLGLEVDQIDREPGLCASAILSDAPYILTDAKADPRSLANPLVAGEFGLRFYAGVPLTTHDGYNLGTLCVIDLAPRTVTSEEVEDLKDLASIVMDQLELRLSAKRAVEHAHLMAREVDHRVMNSLQFVSSLLTMQSRQIADQNAASQLEHASNRVTAIARVHRNYDLTKDSEINLAEYLERICSDLASVLDIEINVCGNSAPVPASWIQPIGLIVNELVTNSGKYGSGPIEVWHKKFASAHELFVKDAGRGLDDDFEIASTTGLGTRVIRALVSQLDGQLTIRTDAGGNRYLLITIPSP